MHTTWSSYLLVYRYVLTHCPLFLQAYSLPLILPTAPIGFDQPTPHSEWKPPTVLNECCLRKSWTCKTGLSTAPINKYIYIYLWYIKYRYIFVNINGQFTTYDDVAISASEFIRSLESAWREVTCSSDSKCNTIIDNVIDRVRQLQRLYVPSDEPIEMGWQY